MNKTVIFAGTTEGRELSEILSQKGCEHTVCVAGDYGAEMLKDSPFACVHSGRMNREEMMAFLQSAGFDSEGIVVDATHPYAADVTGNIRAAAKQLGCRYLRVIRERCGVSGDALTEYADLRSCAEAVDGTQGNILLTTGSKELHAYCEAVSEATRARTYVRVLPSLESLKLCLDEGIASDHILAMQGPFSEELNLAVMRQYQIRHIVTKESGSAGGYEEKVRAAREAGAAVHVIVRPSAEEGISVRRTAQILLGEDGIFPQSVVLAGIGMGDLMLQTEEVSRAIAEADAVFGAHRLLGNIRSGQKYEMYRPGDIIAVLEKTAPLRPVILFSGDTGFYSGAQAMHHALKNWRPDLTVKILPGISSIAYLAARIGKSYENAKLMSIHGHNTDEDLLALAEEVRFSAEVYALTSDASDVKRIAGILAGEGINAQITAGKNLSYRDESIEHLTLENAAAYDGKGPVTLYICNPDPRRRPLIRMLEDKAFARGGIPMTKECVRHESIIRLGLKEGDVLYDIGGGTGSVAIEAASLHPSVQVVTFERKQEAVELIRQNIDGTGVRNVTVAAGEACEALLDMPAPDCVFIGGSGGKLRQIIKILSGKGKKIRYVVNTVSLETTGEIMELLKEYDAEDEKITQLSVSDIRKAGSYHMMQAHNPVIVFSFTIPVEEPDNSHE